MTENAPIELDQENEQNWFLEALPPSVRENITKEGWRVSSPDAASFAEARYYEIWTRKKVNDLQAENAVKLLEEEILRIKQRNEQRNIPLVNGLNFWGNHLLDYTLQLRQQDDSVKSYRGLYVEVGTRAQQANFEVADKEAFSKWLQDNGKSDWFEFEVKPKKAVIKKVVEFQDDKVIDPATGSIIDGIVAEPAKIVAKIDVEEDFDESGNPILHPVRQLYLADR